MLDTAQNSTLSNRVLGPVAVLVALVAWAGSFSVGKIVLAHTDVFTLTLVRMTIAGVITLPLLVKYYQPIARADWVPIITFAMMSMPITLLLQFHGLQYTSASIAVLAVGLEVPFVMLWVYVLFNEKPKFISIIIAIIAMVGLILVVGDPQWGKIIGVLMVLGAGMAFALGTVLSRDLFQRYNSTYITALTFALAVGASVPLWVVFSPTTLHDVMALPTETWVGMIYLGLLCTLFAQSLWNWGVARISSTRAAQYIALEPLLGAIIAIVWLDEYWYWGTVVGGAFIVGSMLMNTVVEDDPNAH